MNEYVDSICLESTDTFYTHNREDAFRIVKGTALVYMVPWSKSGRSAGRKKLVGEYEKGRMVPALAYEDAEYTNWRFAIVSKEDTLELEIHHGICTNVLRTRFAVDAGVRNVDREGFEASLVELYNREILKDQVFINRGEKAKPKLEQASFDVMKQAIAGQEAIDVVSKNHAYEVIAYACKRKKMEIASQERMVAACGENISIIDIARQSDLVCRSIVLEADWYKNDCGVIVGRIGKEPIVCIPKKYSGYTYYTHEAGEQNLDIKVAGQIEPKAYTLSKSLPRKKLAIKDVFAFCLNGIPGYDWAMLLFLGLVGVLIGILLPTLNQKIYDQYIPLGEFGILAQMCVLIGTFMIGDLLFSLVKSLVEFRISSRVGYDLQNALYHRIFQLPESFFRNYDSADLAKRLVGVEGLANQFCTTCVTTGLGAAFSLIYLFRMISYSGKLTLLGLVMIVLDGLIMDVLDGGGFKYEKEITESDGAAVGKLYQYLEGIEKIRMAGMGDRFILEYLKPYAEKQFHSIRKKRIDSICSILKDISTYVFSMAFYILIVKKNLSISTGAFIGFNSAFGIFSASMLSIVTMFISIRGMRPAYDRIKPLFENTPEDEDGKDIVRDLSGAISLDKVSFSYSSDERKIINNLSLSVEPGEYVAIVGPSGCGKSTLLKLMLGFEKADSGNIYYDGKDIDSVDKHSLRKRLGVVLQNGKLIAGSIFDNITITAPGASIKEVNQVIEAVGLKDDISSMPMGVHTVLSESGNTISGGQQQRILIARSIMNHPSILFFDEATSALDNITQSKVCAHLDTMNVTRIVIAHRLSTIKNCDRILVLEKGQLVEEGNFDSLMAKKGLFYKMASRQIAE